MTETPVAKLIIKLSIPTVISMLVTSLYNMADTYFVGTIGTEASASVGVVFGLMSAIQACGFTLGHGSGSIISRALGSKNTDEANSFVSIAFFSSIAVGVFITTLGIAFLKPLLRLLGATKSVLPLAEIYGFYILLSAPFMISSFALSNTLRYEGKAALSMAGLVIGSLINIALDYLLIKIFDFGIRGAGIATAVSQTVGFLILVSMYIFNKTQCKIKASLISRPFKKLKSIISTGMPSLLRQGLLSLSSMLLNNAAKTFGDSALSAMGIVSRISFFIYSVGLGIGQGFQPVSAFNYGAGKYKRVKKGFIFSVALSEVFLALLSLGCLFFTDDLVAFFRNDNEVIKIGSFALKVQLIAMIFQPVAICTNMTFQSLGKNKSADFLSALRSGVLFIPVLYFLTYFFGLKGLQLAQGVADISAFLITIPFCVLFLKKLPKEAE